MAFCSKCGTKLTDGAKFCPNCGEHVNQQSEVSEQPKGFRDSFKEGWNEGIGKKNVSDSPNVETEGLSKWEKIALGIAAFVAFTGMCGGFADGMWLAALLSLCALVAVCAVFMGTIEKKYAWTTAIASLLIVLAAIGASAPDENEQAQTQTEQVVKEENQKTKQEEKQKTKQEEKKIAGTYEVKDKIGCTIRITLNEDETATITGVRGEGITYYCTWDDQSYYKNRLVLIDFSDTKRPYLVFDGGTSEEKGNYASCFLSKDGWFYYDVCPETNNPEWRLPAKKIK